MAARSGQERLTVVERNVAENARGIEGLREAVVELGARMDRGFAAVDRRFETIDRQFEVIDRRFEAIDRRFEAIDRRFETMDRRFEAMDQKQSRQFLWIVGIQITTMLAVVGALGAVASVALGR